MWYFLCIYNFRIISLQIFNLWPSFQFKVQKFNEVLVKYESLNHISQCQLAVLRRRWMCVYPNVSETRPDYYLVADSFPVDANTSCSHHPDLWTQEISNSFLSQKRRQIVATTNSPDSRNLPTPDRADGPSPPPLRPFFAGLIEKLGGTLKIPAKYQVRWFRPLHPGSDQPGSIMQQVFHGKNPFFWHGKHF